MKTKGFLRIGMVEDLKIYQLYTHYLNAKPGLGGQWTILSRRRKSSEQRCRVDEWRSILAKNTGELGEHCTRTNGNMRTWRLKGQLTFWQSGGKPHGQLALAPKISLIGTCEVLSSNKVHGRWNRMYISRRYWRLSSRPWRRRQSPSCVVLERVQELTDHVAFLFDPLSLPVDARNCLGSRRASQTKHISVFWLFLRREWWSLEDFWMDLVYLVAWSMFRRRIRQE